MVEPAQVSSAPRQKIYTEYMGFVVNPELCAKIRAYCTNNHSNFSDLTRHLWETFLTKTEN